MTKNTISNLLFVISSIIISNLFFQVFTNIETLNNTLFTGTSALSSAVLLIIGLFNHE